jgi:hypothetical protein
MQNMDSTLDSLGGPEPAGLTEEQRRVRRKNATAEFSRATGLNAAVCRALLHERAWNLKRALAVFRGEEEDVPIEGEPLYDPNSGYRQVDIDDLAREDAMVKTMESRYIFVPKAHCLPNSELRCRSTSMLT